MPGARRGPGFLPQHNFNTPPSIGLAVARPKKKLKALHWEKVDAPQTTIWATHAPTHEAKEEKYRELSKKGVLDEVEKLFLAKEIKAIGKKSSKKDEKKQIISRDLMHNFQISVAKYSTLSIDEVVRLIIHCDKELLDNNVVMEFLQKPDFCDIPDNTAKLMAPYSKDWAGPNAVDSKREQDPGELTREDQIYLYTAFELHHYWKSRMRALALTRTFEPDYDEIASKLQEVVRVSESLRDSTSLISVLGLILDIGNFMNDANKQANGFKLSTLSRLGMLKDDKNESTFADVVERVVRNQYPGWENFVEEIGGVVAAQKLNVEQLQVDAKKYIDNIKNVQMSLDSGNLSDPSKFHPEDRVSIVVQRSMKDARRKAEQMGVFLEEMTKTYDNIMAFYGEDPQDENARRDFFAKLAVFVQEWKVRCLFTILLLIHQSYSHTPAPYIHIRPIFGYESAISGRLANPISHRNPKKRTSNSKNNTAATKPRCAANKSTRPSPTPPPPPTRLPRPLQRAPWTRCSRNCALRRHRRATSATAAAELASKTATRSASRAARRSRMWGLPGARTGMRRERPRRRGC